jgi:hypothetical protein
LILGSGTVSGLFRAIIGTVTNNLLYGVVAGVVIGMLILGGFTTKAIGIAASPKTGSEAFCTAGGASPKALSSVPKNPFLGTYTRENSEVLSVRLLRET